MRPEATGAAAGPAGSRVACKLIAALVASSALPLSVATWERVAAWLLLLGGLVLLRWRWRRELAEGAPAIVSGGSLVLCVLLLHLTAELGPGSHAVQPGPYSWLQGAGSLLAGSAAAGLIVGCAYPFAWRRWRCAGRRDRWLMLAGGLGGAALVEGLRPSLWTPVAVVGRTLLWAAAYAAYADPAWAVQPRGWWHDRWLVAIAACALAAGAGTLGLGYRALCLRQQLAGGARLAAGADWDAAATAYHRAAQTALSLGWAQARGEALVGQMVAQLGGGRLEAGVQTASALLAESLESPAAQRLVADGYARAQRWALAIPHYETALRAGVRDTTLVDSLLSCYLRAGQVAQFGELAAAWNRVPALRGLGRRQAVVLGDALVRLGALRPAAAHFQVAAEEGPVSAYLYYRAGVCRARLGEHERARELLLAAARADPGFAQAHWELAGTLEGMNASDKAERARRRAIELDQAFLSLRQPTDACVQAAAPRRRADASLRP